MTNQTLTHLYSHDGLTIDQIAQRAGRSSKWVRARLTASGCEMRPAGRRITPQQRAEARAAYEHHGSVDKAAASLDLNPKVLRRRLGDAVPMKHPGRPRCERGDAEIEQELRLFLARTGQASFPSRRELRAAGERSLLSAIDRTGGAQRWATALGVPLASSRRAPLDLPDGQR